MNSFDGIIEIWNVLTQMEFDFEFRVYLQTKFINGSIHTKSTAIPIRTKTDFWKL